MNSDRPSNFPWPPILLVGIGIGGWILGNIAPLPWPGMGDFPARVVGLGFGVVGLGLILWSANALARHRTTILPHKGADTVVSTGPYARFRNPIYLGDTLVILGFAELTRNVWFVVGALVFVGLVTWLAILPEERHLKAKFKSRYQDYFERTRRWI